ncbi:hypothetical protein GCM10022267_89730 [Lentzea roselyniae]|uniref:Ketosynthase family 3 (KS3) domain-containing protein n=1 Tax=Lentzea roselyniae TaxID=531940 RepID=A0ABP7CIX2_9PSEU
MIDDTIAIVGMGMVVPGANSPEEFWNLLVEGADIFTLPSPDRWNTDHFSSDDPSVPDKSRQQRAGFITDFQPHALLRAELKNRDGSPWDFNALWLRHSLYQALEHVTRRETDRFAYTIGCTPDGSQHLEQALVLGAVQRELERHGLGESVAAKALAKHLGDDSVEPGVLPLHRAVAASCDGVLPDNTNVRLVDTACSSSLHTMDIGMRDLLTGDCDIAVCGGSFVATPSTSVLFDKLNGLSRSGAVHALDAEADGTLFTDSAALLVLKRLDRAVADGDQILATVAGLGTGADGKGRAVYAPSSKGQARGIRLALDRAGVRPEEVDAIIAHATGTPAGDRCEFLGLREHYNDVAIPVVSNKALVGHTAWAAGAVSVIHAVLALRHDLFPAQYGFRSAPEAFGLDETKLSVPREHVPLPKKGNGQPRVIAVSSFGFGGTNAHLLLREHVAGGTTHSGYGPVVDDDLVIAAWSSTLPTAGKVCFGREYPMPSLEKLLLPRTTLPHLDRAQLMLVDCMQDLDPVVRKAFGRNPDSTGVIVGHTGPTQHAVLANLRIYFDDVRQTLVGADGSDAVLAFTEHLRELVESCAEPSTKDTYAGKMPNILAARLSNHFDLHGPTITVDDGDRSLVAAFALAERYLRFGDLDFVLVGAASGNSCPEWPALFAGTTDDIGDRPVQEGAVLFALTRLSVAEREDLPVLAGVDLMREISS